MMNISALRHNAEKNESTSSESEEGEELTPWPEHGHENNLSYAPYALSSQNQWASYEWSNRNGKSSPKDLPKDHQYPINLFGHTAEQAFADFPEPGNDLSSGEDDDFASHFPDTRPRRPRSPLSNYAISNERHTQSNTQLSPPSSLTFRPELFQSHSYDFAYAGSSSSGGHAATVLQPSVPGLPRISFGSYADDETVRRRGKQLFDEREVVQQFPTTPVASSPLSVSSPEDVSAKVQGKQRSFEDAEDSAIPNMQMSGLHLGVDRQPLKQTRTSPRLTLTDDARRQGHSRSSTSGSVFEEDDDDEEFDRPERHLGKSASKSLIAGRSRVAASRSSKRPVTSEEEEEEESALDQSIDALPTPIASLTKPSGKKRKVNRYSCPVPLCRETFTRRNDVRRHIKNAAVHRDSPEALALLGETVGAGTRCKYCNADLSRSDARMRHERASACGKRTTQKMKDQMLMRT